MMQNLSTLATFVQVAKHMSFTKAAKELYLSQGAVSIQIKLLEEELGFSLFHRKIRKIFLTNEGERLLKVVEPALKKIQVSIESIRSSDELNRLSVSTLSSFATKWLIPRITRLQNEYPELTLKVHTSEKRVDFVSEQIDCAIRFGLGKYPGLNTTHLGDEEFFPVCHPRVRNNKEPFENPKQIRNFILLHDTCNLNGCNVEWEDWADQMGIKEMDLNRGLYFNQADYAIQAAIAGQGVALGRISLVENDLKAGLLVPLFTQRLRSTFSYYFVHPEEYRDSPVLNIFKQWIIRQMRVS